MEYLFFLLVLGSSIWVIADAKSIGVRKGQVGGFFDMGSWGWFFACLLLWIVAFPFYLAKRNEYRRVNSPRAGERFPSEVRGHIESGALSRSNGIVGGVAGPQAGIEMNWFEKHLNWTWALVFPLQMVAGFVLGLVWGSVDPNVSEDAVGGAAWVVGAVIMLALSAWVIQEKGRSLWWLLLSGFFSPLWLSNQKRKARSLPGQG